LQFHKRFLTALTLHSITPDTHVTRLGCLLPLLLLPLLLSLLLPLLLLLLLLE
jgi:hypothetical protein